MEGRAVQRIGEAEESVDWKKDLRGEVREEREEEEKKGVREELERGFDLSKELPIRVKLIRKGKRNTC